MLETFLLPHCGPCDNFCYLGHIKKLVDDDDDDTISSPLYTDPERRNAVRHRQTDRQTDRPHFDVSSRSSFVKQYTIG